MTTFDDREIAMENKFAHDEEMQFRAFARRNKLLALWAAQKMDKDEDAAKSYVQEVILSDFEEKGDADVLRKIFRDLTHAGIKITEADLRREMDQLLGEAKRQIWEEVTA